VERLLVVTEPGDLNVRIGRVSSSSGTPGNDSLEVWKKATINHTREMATLRQAAREMAQNDTVKAHELLAHADSVHQRYKRYTRHLASTLSQGALREFLSGLYPVSYPKRMPDGSVVTVYDE
jgi:thiaminase